MEDVVVTTTVDGTPESGCQLIVFKMNGITIYTCGISNGSGEIELELPPNTYQGVVTKSRKLFPSQVTFTVPDTDGETTYELEIEGVPIGTVAATQPKMCTIYGYCIGLDGRAVQEPLIVETIARSIHSMAVSGGGTGVDGEQIVVTPEKIQVLPDMTGYWEVTLVAGILTRIYFPHSRLEKVFVVPTDLSLVSFKDVREDIHSTSVGVSSDSPATRDFTGNG